MADQIPLTLGGRRDIEIEGDVVAEALGLDPARFRQLMEQRRINVLCERGTGEDAGLYRASFYHEGRRARLVVDGRGRIVDPPARPSR